MAHPRVRNSFVTSILIGQIAATRAAQTRALTCKTQDAKNMCVDAADACLLGGHGTAQPYALEHARNFAAKQGAPMDRIVATLGDCDAPPEVTAHHELRQRHAP